MLMMLVAPHASADPQLGPCDDVFSVMYDDASAGSSYGCDSLLICNDIDSFQTPRETGLRVPRDCDRRRNRWASGPMTSNISTRRGVTPRLWRISPAAGHVSRREVSFGKQGVPQLESV